MRDEKPLRMGFEHLGAQEQVRLGDCLWDAHSAGSKILEFTAGRDLAEYESSEILRAFVGEMLAIYGAALAECHEQFPEQAGQIEHLAEALALREPLAAGSVNHEAVWRFVQGTLPEQVGQVVVLLDQWHQE